MDVNSVHTGPLVGGPMDGNVVTCESPKIPVATTNIVILDGGIKIQNMTGSYLWSGEKESYLWNLETITFPERTIAD